MRQISKYRPCKSAEELAAPAASVARPPEGRLAELLGFAGVCIFIHFRLSAADRVVGLFNNRLTVAPQLSFCKFVDSCAQRGYGGFDSAGTLMTIMPTACIVPV